MNNEQKNPDQKKQASHFMAFYVVALFSIALVLILLSYMTQVRADDQVAHAETQLQEQVSATQGIQAKMGLLQEANNEQAQKIAMLEQSASEAEEAFEQLEKRSKAQASLLKACGHALREEKEELTAEIESMIRVYTLEALDGSNPEKLIWSEEDAVIFNWLRTPEAETETNKS